MQAGDARHAQRSGSVGHQPAGAGLLAADARWSGTHRRARPPAAPTAEGHERNRRLSASRARGHGHCEEEDPVGRGRRGGAGGGGEGRPRPPAHGARARPVSAPSAVGRRTLPDGVRRIARGQADLATEHLDGSAGAPAHEGGARGPQKHSSAVRGALLRATRTALPPRERPPARCGRRLSGVRDAAVMVRPWSWAQRFADRCPRAASPGCANAPSPPTPRGGPRAARRGQRRPRRGGGHGRVRARSASPRGPCPEQADPPVLAPARAHLSPGPARALRAARRTPTPEHLHELRAHQGPLAAPRAGATTGRAEADEAARTRCA